MKKKIDKIDQFKDRRNIAEFIFYGNNLRKIQNQSSRSLLYMIKCSEI